MKQPPEVFNNTQKILYRLCVHGVKSLPESQRKSLSYEDLKKIESLHKKSQIVLNRLKQKKVNEWTNSFMTHFFPKTEATQLFAVKYKDVVDSNKTCSMSFKDLNISNSEIAETLVKSKVLPENFYSSHGNFKNYL